MSSRDVNAIWLLNVLNAPVVGSSAVPPTAPAFGALGLRMMSADAPPAPKEAITIADKTSFFSFIVRDSCSLSSAIGASTWPRLRGHSKQASGQREIDAVSV